MECGLPESLSREGYNYRITSEIDEAQKAKVARYDRMASLGLGLIVAGFAFQLASNFIPSS